MGNYREGKIRRRYTTFGFDNGKKISIDFNKIELFFSFQTKNSLSTSVFIISTISQMLETKFYVFCTQTCENLESIIFANLLSITCP